MLWDVAPGGPGLFRGPGDEGPYQRIFGGQVVAQSLAAIGRTVGSLNARFVRQGGGNASVDYRVSSPDPGFRQVTATQEGRTILTLDAFLGSSSVPAPSRGLDPRGWTPDTAAAAEWLAQLSVRMPFDFRFGGPPSPIAGRRGERVAGQHFWLRTSERLPEKPLQHQCALTYVSDLLLVSTALARHGLAHGRPGLRSASLDHAVWFHSAFRADEWLLYEQETMTTVGARGLCAGRVSDRDGRLIATVRQEVLMRSSAEPADSPAA